MRQPVIPPNEGNEVKRDIAGARAPEAIREVRAHPPFREDQAHRLVRPADNGEGPGSFDALGFTHFWGRSSKGNWVVQRKTSRSRFGRALQRVVEWCRKSRHLPVREQHKTLVAKVRGHYNYFGITGNSRALGRFLHEVKRAWRKWLHRRSNRARMTWERFKLLVSRYPLPRPHIVHSVYRP